jgi:hypothetical protein
MYGVMTAADIDANMVRMNTPWSPPTPIEVLFKQLEEGQRFATLVAEPIADSQLARMGLHLVTKTGMFPDGCREWRLKAAAVQTWGDFKTHFARQDRGHVETTTASMAGYSGTAFVITPPSVAPPMDPLPPGAALAATVLPSGPELVALLSELAAFWAAAARPTTNPAHATPPTRGYCWTHGSTVNNTHTSATCRNKAPGHVDHATWRNKQGGSSTSYVPPSWRNRSASS